MRQYHKGVLFSVSAAEYEERGVSYKIHYIRTLEDCETISQQAGEEDSSSSNYEIWETASGEVFID